ncbi:unnamed protein product, partial [marine sediment metagenome]
IKNLLNKKTIVSGSIGTLMALSGGIYLASDKVQATVYQVAMNTESIEHLRLKAVQGAVADFKKERREIRRELRQYPDDPDLLEDLDEVEDEIDALQLVQKCMADPEKEVCG